MKIVSCYTINPRSSVRKPCALRVLPNWPLGYHPDPQRAVLITPQNETKIQKFADLTQPSAIKIALGEPQSVPAGQYGAEVLKFYNLLEVLIPKIVYAKDIRQVLTYVETGNVSAGLVYATDAKTSQKVRIAATAPKESHAPIVYPMAILKNSKNINAAQSFSKFLVSNPSKAVFNPAFGGLAEAQNNSYILLHDVWERLKSV